MKITHIDILWVVKLPLILIGFVYDWWTWQQFLILASILTIKCEISTR